MGDNVKPMVRRLLPLLFLFVFPLRAEQVLEMPRATLAELAAAPDVQPATPHVHRRFAHAQSSAVGADMLPVVAPQATTTPPALGTNFLADASGALYPVDAGGAVGPQHVVSAFNSGLIVYDRHGTRLMSASLFQFFSDPSIISGVYYDPRLIYDASANRWFLAALYDRNLKNSQVVIGVSDTGNPAGSWSRYRITVDPQQNFFSDDFTQLGMTSDRFVISANNSSGGSDFYAITKAEAYTTLKTFKKAINFRTDVMPVTFVDNSTDVAYMLSAAGDGIIELLRLDDAVSRVQSYTTERWAFPINTEIAPQLFGPKMDVGEPTVAAATGRAGVIWMVHSIVSTTAPVHSGIRWWRIPIGSANAETGTIDDPTAATFYGFPSIAVNRLGGALIGYSLYSPSRFPTAAYAYRDPSGVMSTSGILKEGENPPSVTRWGDYTTTVVDPVNDLDFWSVQPFGNNQLWGAWWGQITIPAPPPRVRAVRH